MRIKSLYLRLRASSYHRVDLSVGLLSPCPYTCVLGPSHMDLGPGGVCHFWCPPVSSPSSGVGNHVLVGVLMSPEKSDTTVPSTSQSYVLCVWEGVTGKVQVSSVTIS